MYQTIKFFSAGLRKQLFLLHRARPQPQPPPQQPSTFAITLPLNAPAGGYGIRGFHKQSSFFPDPK